MTATTPFRLRPREDGDPVPDGQGLRRAHRSLLRDADRLTELAEHLAAAGRPVAHRRAAAVRRHLLAWGRSVRAHHRTEDELLWPVLAASAGRHLDLSELRGDHAALEALLARVDGAGGAFAACPDEDSATALALELADLRAGLHEHVGAEEAVVLPVLEQYVSVRDWQRVEARLAGRRWAGPALLGPLRLGPVLLGPVRRRRERRVFGG